MLWFDDLQNKPAPPRQKPEVTKRAANQSYDEDSDYSLASGKGSIGRAGGRTLQSQSPVVVGIFTDMDPNYDTLSFRLFIYLFF